MLVNADPTRVIQVLSEPGQQRPEVLPRASPVESSAGSTRAAATRRSGVDHGRGIPADQLDRVFDKFHRVEDPLRMTTSGTGLGLFIARRLTGAMGGTLTVESMLGKGATFCFEMPLAPLGHRHLAYGTRPECPFGLPAPRSRQRSGGRRPAVPSHRENLRAS